MSSSSTLPADRDLAHVLRARTLRRIGLALLAVFVLAGATGLLGTHTSHKSVHGGGYEMTVTYPRISRPGHAVLVQIQVHRAGGFGDDPVVLRYSTGYLEMFDENAFTPQPESETAGLSYTEDEFSPPDGDNLVITVDTRIEPARQHGADGWVSIVDDAGNAILTAAFSTFLWP